LGLEDSGGMVRVGATHYNTLEEVERLKAALFEICNLTHSFARVGSIVLPDFTHNQMQNVMNQEQTGRIVLP
jgi:hypothetical protein